MGCVISHPKSSVETPLKISSKKDFAPKSKVIQKKEDVDFSNSDMINEKSGKITKAYSILNPPLGKGAFGEVRKAIHKQTSIHRAIKIINKASQSQEEQEKLLNEVKILKGLDHPNIIKIIEFYQDERYFYIVTELCNGGELFDKIIQEGHFSEKKAADVMHQVFSAIFYCHSHKIVHRDLKPENLLFEGGGTNLLKVIDFGTSRVYSTEEKMNQKFGTPYYIAPEVLKKRYDEKCDIWSCGVILYILLCGFPPFNGQTDRQIMDKVVKGTFDFNSEEWTPISLEAKTFIKRLLEYDPAKRISAEQAINDPWLKKFAKKDSVDIPIITKTLENMRSFRAGRKLQEATWVFLVNYLSTNSEKSQLLKIFNALDLNGDGQLSRDELIIGYKKIMNEVQAQEEVDRIMSVVDKNNSGAIDYTEFVMATINRENLLSKLRLETAFKMFDKDGSGSLSIRELKEIFGGDKISDEIWREIIKEVDDNGDGEISYKEFKEMMIKLI